MPSPAHHPSAVRPAVRTLSVLGASALTRLVWSLAALTVLWAVVHWALM